MGKLGVHHAVLVDKGQFATMPAAEQLKQQRRQHGAGVNGGAAREARRCMNRSKSSKLEQRNDRQRQTVLGTTLKRLYADVAEQPVPDGFLSLLEQADRKRQS